MNREDIETYIIGTLLFDETNLNIEGLSSSIFKNERYKVILDAMLTIFKGNPKELNTLTLINYLKMIDKLDFVGGEPELVGLQSEIPTINTRKQLISSIKKLRNL